MARRKRDNDANLNTADSRTTGFGRARRQSRRTLRPASQATPVATYSIAACDLEAAQWGVATQSKFLAVGSVVPWAEPHVGAIATQAHANPRYGPAGLRLLREGRSAAEAAEELTGADAGRGPRRGARAPPPHAPRALRADPARRVAAGRRQARHGAARAPRAPRLRRRARGCVRDLGRHREPRGADRRRRPDRSGRARGAPLAMSERGWEAVHVDELDSIPVAGVVWHPVRRR